MVKVITYGTYDLFHKGHYNLLKHAKELGDYLIVAVTSDAFDKARGKLNVHDSLITRIKNVEATGLADEVIVEEYFGQKIDDIKKYDIDIFTVGSDWVGHFDYLSEYCKVIYLDRTKGISSTELRSKNAINLGIIGAENIVTRFIKELNFVSGINIVGIYDPDLARLTNISSKESLRSYDSLYELFDNVDSLYVAAPPKYHYEYIRKALEKGKHVLCEFPFSINYSEAEELALLAKEKRLILMEALKTAYCPAFCKLVPMVKSGLLGDIIAVDACFTQIQGNKLDEQVRIASGGSVNALASYPLLAIVKVLGTDFQDVRFVSKFVNDIDIYTHFEVFYKNALGNGTVAINAKNEGALTVTGTKGYLYVPAPWWKTDYFEIRYENINDNSKYFYKFDGDGLRYEIVEFLNAVKTGEVSQLLTIEETLAITKILNLFKDNINVEKI